jgi:phospho-N-acetylmuramoyl-pentapeptide-transferase
VSNKAFVGKAVVPKAAQVTIPQTVSRYRFPKLSGRMLLWSLVSALTLAAISFDAFTGAWATPWRSLTGLLWVSGIASAGIGHWVVPLLRSLKAGQVIREDGPQAHLKKAGTPTMGGIFFIPIGVAIALLWTGFNPQVIAVSCLTLAYGFIGWLDDWQILRRKSNKGISPRTKLALQVGFGTLFCLWVGFTQSVDLTTIVLPFGFLLPLSLLFWPIALFALVAESNATNLTDGVDGLAGGTGAIAFLGLAALVWDGSPSLAWFCVALAGACAGFVVHNRNPAQVFMGDTGSLALGGALTGVAILTHSLFGLLLIGGIFLAETLSVIAQVAYFKATKDENGVGKRLFRMAPLHHHFELSGWTETQVVGCFYLVGGVLALGCLALL